jgi:choline/ethanolamine kinase
MAKIVDSSEPVEPTTVIFREFGNTEGFVDKNLEQFIFSEIGRMNLGPKEYAAAPRWRIEEFINDATHPTCDMQHEA